MTYKRHILILLTFIIGIFTYLSIPPAAHAANTNLQPTQQYVVDDYANILTPEFKNQIVEQEKKFKQTKQQPQIVVMTVKSTGDDDITDFADDLLMHPQWKFGKKGINNGVLILFAQNKGQNNLRISTGYGVESILPDARIHEMIEPYIKDIKSSNNAKINQGLQETFTAISNVLDKEYANQSQMNTNSNGLNDQPITLKELFQAVGMWLIVGIFTFIFLILADLSSSEHNELDEKTSQYKRERERKYKRKHPFGAKIPVYASNYPNLHQSSMWPYATQYKGHKLLKGILIGAAGTYLISQLLDDDDDYHNHHHYGGGSDFHDDDFFGGGGFGGSDDFGGFDGGSDGGFGGFSDDGGGGDFGGGGDSW